MQYMTTRINIFNRNKILYKIGRKHTGTKKQIILFHLKTDIIMVT